MALQKSSIPWERIPKDSIIIEHDTAKGDMVVAYRARIKGIKVEGLGDTAEEAWADLLERINKYVKCCNDVSSVILNSVGLL